MAKKGVTILVVDDEESTRELFNRIFENEGYRYKEASNGSQAWEILENNSIELMILDIKMPGKSGVELLPELGTRYSDMAIIMVTGIIDIKTAIHCIKQGAYDYITKPFDIGEVMRRVNRALVRRRLKLETRDYRQKLQGKVEIQATKIRNSFLNSVTALAYALEAKDKYTQGHSQRVSEIAVLIARELGIPKEELDKIRIAGLVHDIGKIGIREDILNKKGRLTDEEYQHIISHCVIGEHILSPIVEDREIIEMVRHHHEHYDGTGYPDGLSGEQIPHGARILAVADSYTNLAYRQTQDEVLSRGAMILAVADAYDAMTSNRPYRTALPPERALEEIKQGAGAQFDPNVVDAFLRVSKTDIFCKGALQNV